MKITRDNYESWFLDYLEGLLDEGMTDDFIRFVLENPDLKEELTAFEAIPLQAPEMVFEEKEKLKKEIFDLPEEFDHAAIAHMEGDLDTPTKKHFEEYLQHHPVKQNEAGLYQLTRLVPDSSVVYPGKNKLYHTPVIRVMMNWTMRVAAGLLVAALAYAVLDHQVVIPGPGTEVAETEMDAQTGDQGIQEEILPPTGTEIAGNQGQPSGMASDPVSAAVSGIQTHNHEKPLTAVIMNALRKDIPPALPGSIENSGQLTARLQEELPEILPGREINLETAHFPITLAYAAIPGGEKILPAETGPDSRSLNEIIMEKTGLDDIGNSLADLSLSKVTRFGLKMAASLSNEKFSFHTNNEGEITAYNLDTRLLGLSIPVNKD